MYTKGRGWGGKINWEIGIDIYIPCIKKQTTNENPLYNTRPLFSVLWWPKWEGNIKERGYIYMCVCIYVYMNNWLSLLHQKLIQLVRQLCVCESHSAMSDSLWSHGLYSPWNSLGQNTGVGSLFLLQGIFPTQGSNRGLLHCKWILYQLNYQGSLKATILQ